MFIIFLSIPFIDHAEFVVWARIYRLPDYFLLERPLTIALLLGMRFFTVMAFVPSQLVLLYLAAGDRRREV